MVTALVLCASGPASTAAQALVPTVLEVRVYTLKPGARDAFHARFMQDSLPLLRRARMDVVAFGPSLHDADSYYLMRGFASLEERERSEATFYDSREWRDGPRDAVLAAIETYTTAVITVDTHPDGRPGRGRYTDIWARRDGRWLAVAAQFMRQ